MSKLQKDLRKRYEGKMVIEAPRNCQKVIFEFETLRNCNIVGSLADKIPPMALLSKTKFEEITSMPKASENDEEEDNVVMKEYNDNYVVVSGIMARKGFDHLIFDEDQISEFTTFTKVTLNQKQSIPYDFEFQYFLDSVNDIFECTSHSESLAEVEGVQIVKFPGRIQLEWRSSPKCDLVADTLGLIALQITKTPTSELLLQTLEDQKK